MGRRYGDPDWMNDWMKTEAFSKQIGDVCTTGSMQSAWEPNKRIALPPVVECWTLLSCRTHPLIARSEHVRILWGSIGWKRSLLQDGKDRRLYL